VRAWTGTTATLVAGAVEHGALFEGLNGNGAVGKNIYIAISKDSTIPSFGKVMYESGSSEFAMLACELDYKGDPVSGQYKPIACKVGSLTR